MSYGMRIPLHYKIKIKRLWKVVKIFRVSISSTKGRVFLTEFPSLISVGRMASFISQLENLFKLRKKPAKSMSTPVQLVDKDGLMDSDGQVGADEPRGFKPIITKASLLRFCVTGMYQSQGLFIQQNNLTYRNCCIYMINPIFFVCPETLLQ